MRRRVGFTVFMLAALASSWTVPALSKEAPATVDAEKTGPPIIAPADIQVRADADERFAQDAIERSKGSDPTTKLESRLEALGTSVAREGQHFKRDELQFLSIMRLESLERHWNFYERRLTNWQRELKQAMSPYTEDAVELAQRRASWNATLAAAEASGVAPALESRVRSVLRQLALAEQAVSGPLDRQTRLSQRANTIDSSVRSGERAVTAAIAYNDSRLRRIDSPPLWELWRDPQASGNALQSVATGMEFEKRFVEEYNSAYASLHRWRNLFALVLLPLLLWLSARTRRVASDDPEIQASTRVLRRPISSWVVLVLATALLVEPDAPILVQQVALLLILVPVLRLLPPRVYEVLGPWPYVATGLYLLYRLSFLLLANSFYYRVYLLGVTLLTAALMAWLLWRARPRSGAEGLTVARRLLRTVGWGSVVLLLVSAIANVVGNVSLAEMLTGGLIDSGYVGLALYAGVTVLASVLRLLLARRAVSRFRIVTQHAGPLLQSFNRLLRFGALVAWIIVLLNEFRIYRPIRGGVLSVLTYEVGFGKISITLGGVLLFGFSVWLAFWAAKTVRLILQDEVLPKMSLPRGVANSISSLTYYALVIVGLIVALAAAGFEVSQLAFVVGALGVGIGFGLQNVVNNFVSGLILMFERPIQPGDVVEVSGTSGKVREIGMRATTLSTFEGADVVVPNGVLLNEKLINWTLSDMDRRIDVNLGVAYGNDPKRVLELLMEVTKATPGIASDPEPTVLFVGFGPNSLDFAVRSWTNNFGDWVKIRSDLTVRVHDALKHAGIEIPFPQQDLHLRSISAQASAVLSGTRASRESPDVLPPEPRPAV